MELMEALFITPKSISMEKKNAPVNKHTLNAITNKTEPTVTLCWAKNLKSNDTSHNVLRLS